MSAKVHIFWDNSNIFIPAQYAANRREGPMAEPLVRIHFENLYNLARAGRKVARASCVGSVPPELRAIWDRLRRLSVNVETYERGAGSGTEQAVDQALQVHMLRALADYKDSPGVAVLLTGDGAGYDTGAGYHADLERMKIVLSWVLRPRAQPERDRHRWKKDVRRRQRGIARLSIKLNGLSRGPVAMGIEGLAASDLQPC